METQLERIVATRIPYSLLDQIENDMKNQNYATYSEYIRAALREKLAKNQEEA